MLVLSKTLFLLEPLVLVLIMYTTIVIAATATKKPIISIGFLLFLDLCIRRLCVGIITISDIIYLSVSMSVESGNSKCTPNSEKVHLILNKYGYVFTRICFKDSLRLFTLSYTE